MDSESLERASFVGHSFGSLIVQHLAAAYPQRVDKLALVGPVRAPAEQGRQGSRARAATVRAEGMLAVADTIVGAALCPATLRAQQVTVDFLPEQLFPHAAGGYAPPRHAVADTMQPQHPAAAYPQRVDKLALVGPVRAPAEQGRQGSRARAATVRAEGMLAVADTIVGAALCPATLRAKPVTVAFVRELLLRQPARGYAATCEALADACDPDYSRIEAPVLLLTGKIGRAHV